MIDISHNSFMGEDKLDKLAYKWRTLPAIVDHHQLLSARVSLQIRPPFTIAKLAHIIGFIAGFMKDVAILSIDIYIYIFIYIYNWNIRP